MHCNNKNQNNPLDDCGHLTEEEEHLHGDQPEVQRRSCSQISH